MNIIFLTFAGILVLSVICGKYIHKYRFKYATEGSASLLLGTCITGLVSLCYWLHTGHPLPVDALKLPDSVFFHILLPPIIFYAGFSIKKRMFFANFCMIFTFGFLGTLTSAAVISWAAAAALQSMGLAGNLLLQSSLALGAVCACSDTVGILQIMDKRAYPVLYNLVFGEGIVNDAVAVVLLTAVSNLTTKHSAVSVGVVAELLLGCANLFVSSLMLGVAIGLLSALLVRHIFGKQHDCDREVLLLALLGYLSYLLADAVGMSAILAVFFCGVTMSHYTWHSMCPAAQALALHAFRLAAGLMEMILYAYSGINIWTSALWQQPAPDPHMHLTHALTLASVLLLAIIAARVAFTYPVAAAASWFMACSPDTQQRRHISRLDATVIAWGGLARGAITLALAYHHFSPARKGVPTQDHQVMILAVVIIVLVSSIGLGTVTGPLMEWIMTKHKQHQHQQHLLQQDLQQGQHAVEQISSHPGHAAVKQHPGLQPAACNDLHVPLLRSQQQHLEENACHTAAAAAADRGVGVNGAASPAVGHVLPSQRTGAITGPRDADTLAVVKRPDHAACLRSSKYSNTSQYTVAPAAQPASFGDSASGTLPHASPFAAAAAAVAAAEGTAAWQALPAATVHRRLSVGSTGSTSYFGARGRLPSMDELTEYIGEADEGTVNSTHMGSSISSTPSLNSIAEAAAAAVGARDTHAAALPADSSNITIHDAQSIGHFQKQQQQLLLRQQALVQQQLQQLQLSLYEGSLSAAGELPLIATPSQSDIGDMALLGTYLALSRFPSTTSAITSAAPPGAATGQQCNAADLESAQPGQAAQVLPGQHTSGYNTIRTEGDRGQQWYLKQQLWLLHQLQQVQQEAQQRQCRQQHTARLSQQSQLGDQAVSRAAGRWHWLWNTSVHAVWKWFDVKYLQPVFGGREVAARTSMPMGFEHYGVEV